MRIITLKEARRRGLKRYFTGKPCKRGHVAEQYVSTLACVECYRTLKRAWRVANPEKYRAQDQRYRAAHPEKKRAKDQRYRAAHPEKVRAQDRRWRVTNPARYAAKAGLSDARRRAPGCVPDDFDFEATVPFYDEARRRTHETGTPHEVDHKHALCLGGLHIASNLQVITEAANQEKGKAEKAEAKRRKQQGKTA
jgi:hypothetical protein